MLNEHAREILQSLSSHDVRFLVVGAYAMVMYGYVRATGDFDIWVEASLENSRRVYLALNDFGAPLSTLSEATFAKEGIVFQIGVAPRRIDIITRIDGVEFRDAWESRQLFIIEGMNMPFLSLDNLIMNKRATGRDRDRVDADILERRRID